jgi:choline dehydrogenase
VLEADLIIVGAGTAGCLLARRLVEQTSARVVVLEAGPRYPAWALAPPLAGLRLRPHWSWPQRTVPQRGLQGREIAIPMGRVVGGTSSVNAMVAAPGPSSDFDDWDTRGCPGWSAADIAASLRAVGGELQAPGLPVSAPTFQSPFTTAFLEACEQAGLRRTSPFTGGDSQTCGVFPLFQQGGRRCSAAGMLTGLARHPRFRLVTGQTVRRVVFRRQVAVGVEMQAGARLSTLQATTGVILCTGALRTPHLLQCSGVGPAALLTEAGIPLELDQPAVGRGLQDHVGAPLLIESRVASPGRPARWLPAALQWLFQRSGVMTSNCCEAGCFLGPASTPPSGEIFTHFQTHRRSGAVELMCVLLQPASRGTVRIDAAAPWGPPRIDPAYLTEPSDGVALRQLVDQARDIVNQPALRRFGLGAEVLPGDVPWDRYLPAHASTCHHPVGSCRMGTGPDTVVDPHLRVRGLAGLWVVDNSIAPVIPRGHTASTALIIAEQAARLIAAQLSGSVSSSGVAGGSPPPRREPPDCPTPPDALPPDHAGGAAPRA